MLLFFAVATLITLQASLLWWVIPVVIAIPVVLVLGERSNRVLKAREAARVGRQLPTGGPSGGDWNART